MTNSLLTPMPVPSSVTLRVQERGDFHFDLVAVLSSAREIGKLEGDYVGDGMPSVSRFWIGNCHVVASHRRKGVGRALVAEALRQAARRYHATHAFIDVSAVDGSSDEEAKAFWTANEFVAVPPSEIPGRARLGTFMKAKIP